MPSGILGVSAVIDGNLIQEQSGLARVQNGCEPKIVTMRMKAMSIVLTVLVAGVCAAAQKESESAIQASVCDLVNHPLEFRGKQIQVRAQIWSDISKFWLNESWAGSPQIGRVCQWLPAGFTYPTRLIGSSAFGTFTGRLVYNYGCLTRGCQPVRFLVEHESDIYKQEVHNGKLVVPTLYDRSTNTLVRPE